MIGPPPLARLLLRLVRGDIREFVEGDLVEEFGGIEQHEGSRRARRWFWKQTIAAIAANPRWRHAGPGLITRGDGMMRTFGHDLRYAFRMLRRQPGFSAIVIATLALAIGANTVIFGFADILILRPLPMRDPDRLAWIMGIDPQHGDTRARISVPDLLDLRRSVTTVDSLEAAEGATYTLTGRGDAIRVNAMRVTSGLLSTWGTGAVLGRTFVPGDDAPGAPGVVVLSHRFWAAHFASDPSVVGSTIGLEGRPVTVAGVLDPAIEVGSLTANDIWTPLVLDRRAPRDVRDLSVVGRIKPGASLAQVDAQVRAAAVRLEAAYPATNAGWGARAASTKESAFGPYTWLLLTLLTIVVGFVLLIACANIGNLLLSRGTVRARELALRKALGASRARLVCQMTTESLLLGVTGGFTGLLLASFGLHAIKAAAYEPFWQLLDVDRNVLAFTALLSVVAPLIFTVLPALQASRTDVNETLKEGTARTSCGTSGRRSRTVLVVSQLALAMTLLIVSTLIVRSMMAINSAPIGFMARKILTAQIDVPAWKYADPPAVATYQRTLLQRLHAIPGVTAAALTDRLPMLEDQTTENVDVEGRPVNDPKERPWASIVTVSNRFFDAAGIPLVAGREFGASDDANAEPVGVINREMARRFWNDPTAALGAQVRVPRPDGGTVRVRIVGITGDTLRADLRGSDPHLYLSLDQHPTRVASLVVRSDRPRDLESPVRSVLRGLDRDVPVARLQLLTDDFRQVTSTNRILSVLFGSFAALALVMAALGLFGVISYAVSQRSREIGIRMALGAASADVRRLVMRQAFSPVVAGVTIGLVGGAALGRLASRMLYRTSAADPLTYISVTVILVTVAAIATWAPLRRATRVDPLVALRTE